MERGGGQESPFAPEQDCDPPLPLSVIFTSLPWIGAPPSGSVSTAEKVAVPPCWTSCCMGLEVMAVSSSRTVNVAEADEAEYVVSPKNMALTVYGPAASPGVTGHEAVPVRPLVRMTDS